MSGLNPFSHIDLYQPEKLPSLLYESLPYFLTCSDLAPNLKSQLLVPSMRPDKEPKRNMFLWQRDFFGYQRHRKRVFWYWLATFGTHATVCHLAAAKEGYKPDGSGIMWLLRAHLYNNQDLQNVHAALRRSATGAMIFQRYSDSATYNSATWDGIRQNRDYALKSADEKRWITDLTKKVFTGNAEAFDYKRRWFTQLEVAYLPVSNDVATNKQAYESMMRGIEATIEAKPLAEAKKHFAVVEQLREHSLKNFDKVAARPGADGTYDLRFASKAVPWKTQGLYRRTIERVLAPWNLGKFSPRIRWLGYAALFHWIGWLVIIGTLAAPFEDWKLRRNTELLARWGTLDDNRTLHDRVEEVKAQLAEEKKSGKWVFRDWGWLNGFGKYAKREHLFFFDA